MPRSFAATTTNHELHNNDVTTCLRQRTDLREGLDAGVHVVLLLSVQPTGLCEAEGATEQLNEDRLSSLKHEKPDKHGISVKTNSVYY